METLTRSNSTRPRAWQQGDRVKLRPDVCHHDKYRAVKGRIGEVELANEAEWFSTAGSMANVRFPHENFPNGILVRDILFQYLVPAPSEQAETGVKTKRRSPLNLRIPKDERTEAEKQAEGIAWLTQRGYVVLVVGQYMKQIQCDCGCGHWFWPKGFGNSVGYPDVSISHPSRWGTGHRPVLLQEWKRDEKADRKARQVELAESGISAFVWSLQMCLIDLVEFERQMGFDPHPDALEYLERHAPKETASVNS